MPQHTNALGQPIGPPLPDFAPRPRPARSALEGRLCRLEPLRAERHAEPLHAAFAADTEGRGWTYLPYGPFESAADYRAFVAVRQDLEDPVFFAIVDRGRDRAVGVASYLRIQPEHGSIEVGHLCYSPALQRTAISTEAMYLMMRHAFEDLGYRRYEWKCDALNAPSRRAALRFGFRYEGHFRRAVIVRGRSRDTAWFAVIDEEWPALKAAYEEWLAPGNFDGEGKQRRRLGELTSALDC